MESLLHSEVEGAVHSAAEADTHAAINETVNPRTLAKDSVKTEEDYLKSQVKPVENLNVSRDAGGTFGGNFAKYGVPAVAVVGAGAYTANNLMARVDKGARDIIPEIAAIPGNMLHEAEDLVSNGAHSITGAASELGVPSALSGGVVTVLLVGVSAFVMYEIFSR